MLEFLYGIDKAVFLFFNAYLTHPVLDAVMVRITEFSFWTVPGLLAAALFVLRENKKKALIVLGLTALTVAISDPFSSQILKKIFTRPRPCHPEFFVEGGCFLLGMWKSFSFPSSHSMNMFAVAMLYACFYPKYGIYFFAFASMIGYTRVYNGVHYPSDVLGGALFGCLTGWGIYMIYGKIRDKIIKIKIGRVPTSYTQNSS